MNDCSNNLPEGVALLWCEAENLESRADLLVVCPVIDGIHLEASENIHATKKCLDTYVQEARVQLHPRE